MRDRAPRRGRSPTHRQFHPRRRLRRGRQGGERCFQPRSTPPPSMRGCEGRDSRPLQESSDLFGIARPTLTETLRPLRGESQDRSWQIEAGCRRCCPQPTWISRPSSTMKRPACQVLFSSMAVSLCESVSAVGFAKALDQARRTSYLSIDYSSSPAHACCFILSAGARLWL